MLCGESLCGKNCTYLSLWLGSFLYGPLPVTVATVADAGPYLLRAGLYLLPSMVVCLVYQLSFSVSFWNLCILFILFVLYFVMMSFTLRCPRTVVGGEHCSGDCSDRCSMVPYNYYIHLPIL